MGSDTKGHPFLRLLAGSVHAFFRHTHHEKGPDLSSLVTCVIQESVYASGEEEAHTPTHSIPHPTSADLGTNLGSRKDLFPVLRDIKQSVFPFSFLKTLSRGFHHLLFASPLCVLQSVFTDGWRILGVALVARRGEDHAIERLCVLESERNRGIGTEVLGVVKDQLAPGTVASLEPPDEYAQRESLASFLATSDFAAGLDGVYRFRRGDT